MVAASPWRRLLAALLDGLLLALASPFLKALLGMDPEGLSLEGTLLDFGLNALYYTALTALYGATLGKMALGLKVVRLEGGRVDLLTALMREVVGKTLSALPLFLGYLWAFFHPRRQAWHDLIADTLVVLKDPLPKEA